jgi:hypothetical protein
MYLNKFLVEIKSLSLSHPLKVFLYMMSYGKKKTPYNKIIHKINPNFDPHSSHSSSDLIFNTNSFQKYHSYIRTYSTPKFCVINNN